MTLIITGVGFLIHVYSVGYMDHEQDYARFFACLNFFVFAMLLLVLAANLLLLFVGWEGVGLASYLLIGFWYQRPSAAQAATKAFVVNRIGDWGFLLGLLLILTLFGTSDIAEISERALQEYPVGAPVVVLLTLLLFHRSDRKIGADSAAYLAARCDGGPHTCLGSDPCRYHGNCWRLPGGAPASALSACTLHPVCWWERSAAPPHSLQLSAPADRPI